MAKIIDPLGPYWEQHAEGGIIQTKIGEQYIVRARTGKYGPQTPRRLQVLGMALATAKHWNDLSPDWKYAWFSLSQIFTSRIYKSVIWKMAGQNFFLEIHLRRLLAGYPYEVLDPYTFTAPDVIHNLVITGQAAQILLEWQDYSNPNLVEVFLEKPRVSERLPQYKHSAFHSRYPEAAQVATLTSLRPGWYGVHCSNLDTRYGTVYPFQSATVEVT